MAIQRHSGNGFLWPQLLPALSTFYLASGGLIDAAGEQYAVSGSVWWADGGTHDIHTVEFFTDTCAAGTGTTFRVSLPSQHKPRIRLA